MKKIIYCIGMTVVCCNVFAQQKAAEDSKKKSGNPVFPGFYADPEATIFGNEYWIYPTYSDDYGQPDTSRYFSPSQLKIQKNTINKQYLKQTFINAFSSNDLIAWNKHPHVLDIKDVKWAAYSIWAPAIIQKDKKYFLFFSANDIQSDKEPGGIGVAVSDKPQGPFKDAIGKPLVDKFYNGAQPIDQFVFKDIDGAYYMYYGGWRHCNVVKLSDNLLSVIPFADGSVYKEITPDGYVEGSFMFYRNGKYYFMWSEGGWTGPDYSVAYAIADSPFGPFKRIGKILQQNPAVATGAGHHSVFTIPGTQNWYIVYHRRPLGDTNGNHRQTCIDRMYFDDKGFIKPVVISFEGVEKHTLK